LLWLAGIGVVAACAAAATALGFVSIYANHFGNKPAYREIKTIGQSDKCERSYNEKREVMIVKVTGSRQCAYRPPVQGVSPRPDHRFDVAGRIVDKTPSGLRNDAYLAMSVRVGGGSRYELRVFAKERRFQLRRTPDGGGFPVNAGNNAVVGIGKTNKMSLIAEGDRVRAIINGTEVADVTDPAPGEVKGRRLEFALGNTKNSQKQTVASFDRLKVSVPDP
jgi:hypothetical protein